MKRLSLVMMIDKREIKGSITVFMTFIFIIIFS